ncbi:MAG: hypothetical protein VX378_04585, partial [Pseudomonadota bacterium]|nr:hypothetical protein [Pseudomonadota bacterium]
LREMDPIQRSLIQNRDVLAHATRAEQAEVKRLLEEEQNLNALQAKSDWFKSTAYYAITSLTDGANGVEDAFERVARAIEDAAWQAMLLGEGPFGNAFGGKESGGLLGMISGALFPMNADGGMFYSQGHGRADKGLSWLSSGEFIVNAAATQQHRGLLEAINSGGSLPAFATGGYVGGGASSMSAFQPSFQIINNSSGAITGEVEETTSPTGGRAYRLVLADQVGDALVAPGGGASRTMKNTYGARKRTARR